MIIKKMIAVVMTAVIATGVFSGLNANDVKAVGKDLTSLYADFDEINLKGKDGGDIRIYVDGTSVGIDTNCARNISFRICDESYHPVFQHSANGSFEVEVADDLDVGTFYYIDAMYEADGLEYRQYDAYITKTEEGDITFLKSLCYDFNVERCSELWTDATSLEECLQPQNDVECDDPYVIQRANQITAGCSNDWEKAFAIYNHIVTNFAYDYVQIEDDITTYQDDALALLRREVAICEGKANTFVALCRAAGVPAAVSFGIGEGNAEEMMFNTSYRTDENPNHAWACVCLDGEWYHVDPTWDCANRYEGSSFYGGSRVEEDPTYNWYLLPLELFSMTHKICDADTIHSIESSGSCGDNATYTITRDGTITFSGSGEIQLPYGVNGFRYVEFAPGSNITSIGRKCFYDCDIIESVILPDTVTRIEQQAFATCEDLEYIYIPEGCTYIGPGAFIVCDELAYVYIPDSVTDIDDSAFDYDGRLVISIPSNVSGFDSGYEVHPWQIIVR